MAGEEQSAPALNGVWDRVFTPGRKVQYVPDPESGELVEEVYDFDAETLPQMVRNFSRTFSERRLLLDSGNHKAANPFHEDPESLAGYSGEAAILGGKVIAFWDQFPELQPPDPALLLAELQKKFPRATTPDGMWLYRRDVYPLGQKLLPNMHQISPQFSRNDTDETGQMIGYNISAVSPCYVAHQNGSVLMGKMATPSSALHSPRPLGEDKKMADEKKDDKKPEEGKTSLDEMQKALCAKFGLPENAGPEALMGAMYAKMGDLVIKHEGEEDKKPEGEMGKGKMNDAPDPLVAQMSKQLGDERAARLALEQRVAAREEVERKTAVANFKKYAFEADGGRWRKDDEAGLDQLIADVGGDLDKAKRHVDRIPPLAAMSKHTSGGHPVGLKALPATPQPGAAFSKKTVEILGRDPDLVTMSKTNYNAAFCEAQRRALREEPASYEGWR